MAVELPEAFLLARQMNGALVGKVIECVHLNQCDSLIGQGFINLHEVDVTGRVIESVTAKGKWIYVKLVPDVYLLFALETGGKLLYHPGEAPPPGKFHVQLDFADGSYLTEQIVGWGWAKAVREDEVERHRYPGKPGLSPIDDQTFTFAAFNRVLDEASNLGIKQLLLDQGRIAGIGNGYLQDILFRARIHPKRKAGDLGEAERKALYQTIRETLAEAIRLGGREYDLYDTPGGYQPTLDKHTKGRPCPNCGTPIEKLNVLGSMCYVCPACQQ
jgi:formamidopyrimidine-DNA glycosylase